MFRLIALQCRDCLRVFVYEKKYSHVRKLCDDCRLENRRQQAAKLDFKSANALAAETNRQRTYPRGDEHHAYSRIQIPCRVCSKLVERVKYYEGKEVSCSKECDRIWRRSRYAKERNPLWRGGSRSSYPSDWSRQRERIRERDNRTCQCCGMFELESLSKFKCKLSVHHINYIKEDCQEDNLITLCLRCHNKIKGDKETMEYYKKVLSDGKNIKTRLNEQEVA